MNHISKTHQQFSERLNNPRVLEFPEEFLGPNCKEVLNFWMILEESSEEQLRVVNELYDAFFDEKYSEWLKARYLALESSKEVVGKDYAYHAGCTAGFVTNSWAAYRATLELIGMHLILEQKRPLNFTNLFLNLL